MIIFRYGRRLIFFGTRVKCALKSVSTCTQSCSESGQQLQQQTRRGTVLVALAPPSPAPPSVELDFTNLRSSWSNITRLRVSISLRRSQQSPPKYNKLILLLFTIINEKKKTERVFYVSLQICMFYFITNGLKKYLWQL